MQSYPDFPFPQVFSLPLLFWGDPGVLSCQQGGSVPPGCPGSSPSGTCPHHQGTQVLSGSDAWATSSGSSFWPLVSVTFFSWSVPAAGCHRCQNVGHWAVIVRVELFKLFDGTFLASCKCAWIYWIYMNLNHNTQKLRHQIIPLLPFVAVWAVAHM